MNLANEEIVDSYDSIEDLVLSHFPGAIEEDDDEYEAEDVEIEPIKPTEALSAIQKLLTYHEQQASPNIAYIKQLRQDEINLQRAKVKGKRQSDIRGFFHAK